MNWNPFKRKPPESLLFVKGLLAKEPTPRVEIEAKVNGDTRIEIVFPGADIRINLQKYSWWSGYVWSGVTHEFLYYPLHSKVVDYLMDVFDLKKASVKTRLDVTNKKVKAEVVNQQIREKYLT